MLLTVSVYEAVYLMIQLAVMKNWKICVGQDYHNYILEQHINYMCRMLHRYCHKGSKNGINQIKLNKHFVINSSISKEYKYTHCITFI